MPGDIITPPTVRALYTRYSDIFDQAAQAPPSDLGLVAEEIELTDAESITFDWIGAFPRWREWIGPRYVQGLRQRAFQVFTKPYESTIGVDRFKFDDQTRVTKDRVVKGMGEEAAAIPNDLLLDLLVNGHQRLCYDGQYFFDTDHPISPENSTAQANYVASSFPLNRANFITARSRLRRFKAEGGRIFRARGRLKLVVPSALVPAATDIVGVTAIAIAGGVQNNSLYNAADIVEIPELDDYDANAWYLFEVGAGAPPLVIVRRLAPRLIIKDGPSDDGSFWHKEIIFGGEARYGAGYGAWNRAFKGVGP